MKSSPLIRGLTSAVFVSALTGSMAIAKATNHDQSLLQRLRDVLGIVQPLVAAGSRSSGTEICLISPWIQNHKQHALITESRPILHTKHPLNEITIERNGIPVWQQLASSTQPVVTPIPWPRALDPVEPNEIIVLTLRARHAPAGERVRITLQGASQERMTMHQVTLNQFQQNKAQRPELIKAALNQNNTALVIALLEQNHVSSNGGDLSVLLQSQPCL